MSLDITRTAPLTVRQAAKRAGRSLETVRRWIRQGKLSVLRYRGQAGAYLIPTEALDGMLLLIGVIVPTYRPGSLVMYAGGLARVERYQPGQGYLLFVGSGGPESDGYTWAPEHQLSLAERRV